MKKLILSFALLLSWSSIWSQNKSFILGSDYIPNIQISSIPFPLPIPPASEGNISMSPLDGYDGQTASHAQNIIVDKYDKIVFFIIDQYIYSRKGKLIDVMNSSEGYIQGSVSETVVVPDAEDCNTYHLFSTQHYSGAGVSFAKGYYGKLIVNYDPNGNPLPEAGLVVDPYDNCNKMHSIRDIIGDDIWDANNIHDERPMFAVPPSSGLFNFVFTTNNDRFFRLKMDQNGLVYDNYTLNFNDGINPGIYAGYNVNLAMGGRREEMEVIQMANGNFRVATQTYYEQQNTILRYVGAAIFDLDPNGNLISGSQKLVGYEITGLEYLNLIKGIELSKSGDALYIAHTKMGIHQSTVDVFDLTLPIPTKTIVSSDSKYEYSQIELATDGNMLIPTSNSLDKITGTSISTVVSGLNIPISSLNTGQEQYKVRILQDQLDQYDYSGIESRVYEDDYFIATVSGTWTPNLTTSLNNNPLIVGPGNTVYIQHELRIPAGVTINIQNMVFKFAPEARVIIEHSTNNLQGGKLILNNTVFTNENRCLKDEMWLGVEVWGNQNQTQGNVNNSKQGRLIMENNSRIENARIGVLVSKRVSTVEVIPFATGDCFSQNPSFYYNQIISPFSYEYSRNGGIVQTKNSTFEGNQTGVFIPKYYSTGNNLCKFTNTSFEWNGLLKDPLLPIWYHAKLIDNDGVGFYGCDFKNTAPTLFDEQTGQGIGIDASNATFYVNSYCNSITQLGQPCPSPDKSKFENLTYGIRSFYIQTPKAFSCENSIFSDCRYGTFAFNSRNIRITTNIFRVRENTYQTAGLVMYSSTGYKVEANHFYEFDNTLITDGNGQSYGIWVSNSGTAGNEIYRNYFHNLKIGGQTEATNAIAVSQSNDPGSITDPALLNGLVWRCNQFNSSIYQYDLALMKGSIDYFQGSDLYNSTGTATSPLQAKRMAANNKFSRGMENVSNPGYLQDHDLHSSNSQSYRYVYLPVGYHMQPDNFSQNNSIVVNPAGYIPVITDTSGACPSKLISKTKPILKMERIENKEKIDGLLAIIDKGDRELLLEYIQTWNDKNAVKNELKSGSPYLSDHILLAYINSNPPVAMLKEIILLNSPVSSIVLNALYQKNLPVGTKNQIMVAQIGTSERTKLYSQISYHQNLEDELYYEIERSIILDTTSVFNLDSLEIFYTEEGGLQAMESLIETNILQNNNQKFEQTKSNLIQMNSHPDFLQIIEIEKLLHNSVALEAVTNNNPQLVQDLTNLRDNSNRMDVAAKASTILQMMTIIEEVPEFDRSTNHSMIHENTESEFSINSFSVSIYPNPSTGTVYFDYPDFNEGILTVRLLDLSGKEVYNYSSEFASNGEIVDLSSVRKGLYLAQISIDGSYIETQKLILK